MDKQIREIIPEASYNFTKTCNFASFYRSKYSTDVYIDGVYSRLIETPVGLCLASASEFSRNNEPIIEVSVRGQVLTEESVTQAVNQISRIIGADQNPFEFYKMAESDPMLAPLVEEFRGLHIPQTNTVFEGLILAILGQQISTHVARILREGIVKIYGNALDFEGETYYAFPTPESLATAGVESLHANKFSRRKAEYVCDIAYMQYQGNIDLEDLRNVSHHDATNKLISLRGVGPWTVHWLLIRSLEYQDGFPSGDLALQKIMGKYLRDGLIMSDSEALNYSERWTPYRSWVTTYIFASLRSGLTV